MSPRLDFLNWANDFLIARKSTRCTPTEPGQTSMERDVWSGHSLIAYKLLYWILNKYMCTKLGWKTRRIASCPTKGCAILKVNANETFAGEDGWIDEY